MGFGDNSTVFQRSGTIGAGGLRVETGCWTSGSAADISIPTQLTTAVSFISESGDGSCSLTELVEVSDGYLTGSTNEDTSSKLINYVAFGW